MGLFNSRKKPVNIKEDKQIDENAIPELEKFRDNNLRRREISNGESKNITLALMKANEERLQEFYGWIYRGYCDSGITLLDKNHLDVLDKMRERVGEKFYFDSFRLFTAGMRTLSDTNFALKAFACDHDGLAPSDRGLFIPIDKESFKKCMDMSNYHCIQDIVTDGERALYDYGRYVGMHWDDSREILKYAKDKARQYAEFKLHNLSSKTNFGKSETGVSSDGIAPSQEEYEKE